MMDTPPALLLLGPTAGGKSALAVRLAKAMHPQGEIVSADSMQVYRHLDAGTAKPTVAQQQAVPHHLVDSVDPSQRFTVHHWLNAAHAAMAQIRERGHRPIVVGGTNLYLQALLHGLFDAEEAGYDPKVRAELEAMTGEAMHAQLRTSDPEAAERIDPNDRRRLIRALEHHALTGKPISDAQQQWKPSDPSGVHDDGRRITPAPLGPCVLLGLRWPVDLINSRINLRVKAMFFPDRVEPDLARDVCPSGESLPDEVQRLLELGVLGPDAVQAREALGYKQVLAWLEGTDAKITSLDDAFERTKILTRRFAKQQRTWLKRFAGMHWLDGPTVGDGPGVPWFCAWPRTNETEPSAV